MLKSLSHTAGLPLIGGYIANHTGLDAARLLQPYLKIDWKRQAYQGFFFRAEDFSDFINSVEKDRLKIAGDLGELKGKVDDVIINKMSESMNFSLREMRKQYGENMQAFFHGEAYLKILQTRIGNKERSEN